MPELDLVLAQIIKRLTKYLEKQKIIVKDNDSEFQLDIPDEDTFSRLQASCVTYRFATGPSKGKKTMVLKSVQDSDHFAKSGLVVKNSGFSLHAGVATKASRSSDSVPRQEYSTSTFPFAQNAKARSESLPPSNSQGSLRKSWIIWDCPPPPQGFTCQGAAHFRPRRNIRSRILRRLIIDVQFKICLGSAHAQNVCSPRYFCQPIAKPMSPDEFR